MFRSTASLLLLCATSISCAGARPPQYPALARNAAQNLHCADVEYAPMGERHVFSGCGREVEVVVVDRVRGRGGERGAVVPAASNTFARETGCKLRDTTLYVIDDTTETVSGCGRTITYARSCRIDCRWTAQSDMHVVVTGK